MNNKISIIMPLYNNEHFVRDTINSVIKQTYADWEIIVVNDCSSDNSMEVVQSIMKKDNRIKLINLESNKGAAISRNTAIHNATGRFIAFLDADDLWDSTKLENQLEFMLSNNYGFTCTSYRVIAESGENLNKEVHMLKKFDYNTVLRNNLIQTVGVMVNTSIVPKELMIVPDIRRGQDLVMWLQILKNGYDCYGMQDVLASYRRMSNSLSSNKFKAVKRTWNVYRNIEKLPFLYATYVFIRYAILAVWKRKHKKGSK